MSLRGPKAGKLALFFQISSSILTLNSERRTMNENIGFVFPCLAGLYITISTFQIKCCANLCRHKIGFVFSNMLFLEKHALSIVEGSMGHKATKAQRNRDMYVIVRPEGPWQSLGHIDELALFFRWPESVKLFINTFHIDIYAYSIPWKIGFVFSNHAFS